MGEGLALTITVDGQDYPCRLPLMPIRFALVNAWRDCILKGADQEHPDTHDLAAICFAAVALCWAGAPFRVEYWHEEVRVDEVELEEVELDDDGAALLDEDDEPIFKTAEVETHIAEMRSVWVPPADRLFRILDRDVVRFGEHVQAGLSEVGLIDHVDIYKAGRVLHNRISGSIPKKPEVEKAAEDFSSKAADSTETTAGLA